MLTLIRAVSTQGVRGVVWRMLFGRANIYSICITLAWPGGACRVLAYSAVEAQLRDSQEDSPVTEIAQPGKDGQLAELRQRLTFTENRLLLP